MHVTTGVRSGWIGDHSKTLHRHTIEMEQIMTRLLAEIRTNQEKSDANLNEIWAGQQHLKLGMRLG
jgi:hypothetical protein